MLSLLNIKQLQDNLSKIPLKNRTGLLFCFGASFISQVIQAKTRLDKDEQVPSHVAMVYGSFLYESTSAKEKAKGNKTIPAGVRRYLLTDFYQIERSKDTQYYFIPFKLDKFIMEKNVHRPYGKDIILDYLLKDGSDGDSKGLICSQYANKCAKVIDSDCVNPAELLRATLKLMEDKDSTDESI